MVDTRPSQSRSGVMVALFQAALGTVALALISSSRWQMLSTSASEKRLSGP